MPNLPEFKIKTSVCPLISKINSGKKSVLSDFLSEYDRAVRFYINYLWNNRIEYGKKDKPIIFDRKRDLLNCPIFISSVNIPIENTILSARAVKSATSQACDITRSILKKRKKLLFVKEKLLQNSKRIRHINKLLKKENPVKPNPKKIYRELNSFCSLVSEDTSDIKADCILTLSALFKKEYQIKDNSKKLVIPFNHTKHSRGLSNRKGSELLKGIQISSNKIYLRY